MDDIEQINRFVEDFPKRRFSDDIVAGSVQETVSIAEAFREEGKYDWFRGQIGLWPLVSTYLRGSEEDRNVWVDQLGRFERWAKATPGVAGAASQEDADRVIAIAQHYGIPTSFVDSTAARILPCRSGSSAKGGMVSVLAPSTCRVL